MFELPVDEAGPQYVCSPPGSPCEHSNFCLNDENEYFEIGIKNKNAKLKYILDTFSTFELFCTTVADYRSKIVVVIWSQMKAPDLLFTAPGSFFASICILGDFRRIFPLPPNLPFSSEPHISATGPVMWSRIEWLEGEDISASPEYHIITLNS